MFNKRWLFVTKGPKRLRPKNTDGFSAMTDFNRITIDAGQMGGVPCVRHLRIPVGTVLRLLAGGLTTATYFASIQTSKRRIFVSAYASPPPRSWRGNCLSLGLREVRR